MGIFLTYESARVLTMKRLFAFLFLLVACFATAQNPSYRLKVLSWSCQFFPRGAIIQGVVQNVSSRAMADLRANVRVVGRGLRVATNSAMLKDRNLAPGEKSSFEVRVKTTFNTSNRCELWFRNAQAIQIEAMVPNPQ